MNSLRLLSSITLIASVSFCLSACAGEEDSTPSDSLASWEAFRADPPVTWEDFSSGVYRQPAAPYHFIVDGDVPLRDEAELRGHYDKWLRQEFKARGGQLDSELTVMRALNADVIWPRPQRDQLTYCISDTFPAARKAALVTAMGQAATSWNERVAVQFAYRSEHDAACTTANNSVMFNVSPAVGPYFASAFFPNYGRASRQLSVYDDAFTTNSGGRDLQGILRHELGHVLGFVHEHTRLVCTGEVVGDERVVNQYDVNSVMHYPQCRPGGAGGYRQTALDFSGAISLYGSSREFTSLANWSAFFSNSAGWATNENNWGTLDFPDINGDNRADVCGRSALGLQCGLSSGTAFILPTPWGLTFGDLLGWTGSESYWRTISYPDLNGDNRQDVCGRNSAGLQCALSTGLTFGVPTTWSSAFSDVAGWSASQSYWKTIQYPDLNGDNRQDVCGRSAAGMLCALANGSGTGFLAATIWTTELSDAVGWGGPESRWGTLRFPDLNGDGKADVCGRSGGGIRCGLSNGTTGFAVMTQWTATYSDGTGWDSSNSYWATIRFPDLNGDGKADVCGRSGGGPECAVSDGTAFVSARSWNSDFSNAAGWNASESHWGSIGYPDINGDGRADICGRRGDGMLCALSTGFAFTSNSMWTSGFGTDGGWTANRNQWQTIRYPDVNGDGKGDVCGRGSDGIWCAR